MEGDDALSEAVALHGQMCRTPPGYHWLIRQNPGDARGAFFANVVRNDSVGLVQWGRTVEVLPDERFPAYGPTASEALRRSMDAAHGALGTAVH
jgi:hypothetical protein